MDMAKERLESAKVLLERNCLKDSFQIRNNTDYGDFYVASREDAQLQLQRAEEIYDLIKNYLEESFRTTGDAIQGEQKV